MREVLSESCPKLSVLFAAPQLQQALRSNQAGHAVGSAGAGVSEGERTMRRWLEWPVQIGSQWKSINIPNKLFEVTMADSNGRMLRLNAIMAAWEFKWEGTAHAAGSEFYVEEDIP